MYLSAFYFPGEEAESDFLFDLRTLLSLRAALPETDFRRAEVENALYHAHLVLCYDPDSCGLPAFRGGLAAAAPLLKEQLAKKNGSTAPFIGLIGHSHIDEGCQKQPDNQPESYILHHAEISILQHPPYSITTFHTAYNSVRSTAFHTAGKSIHQQSAADTSHQGGNRTHHSKPQPHQ